MSILREIEIEMLRPETAAVFGRALVFDGRPATSSGEWWRCWEGCAELSAGRQWVGFVQASGGNPEIRSMEREPGTEIVIPVDGELVQVVATGTRDATGVERPDALEARAFVLKPGTALVMAPGVWHAAAFGLRGPTSYFYVAERRKAEDSEGRGGWVEFADRFRLSCRFPANHEGIA
ncbi:ureidoglycolate lyase [Mycoplana ramosa]|uniref:Ureidoglycolate lyase n=1 Tax=Mycoplana ramosa TaxID=40837 RepID=A0ABW3Z2Q7_MYCRA